MINLKIYEISEENRIKPIDPVFMLKVLFLQRLYNISDNQVEYQIKDRMSYSYDFDKERGLVDADIDYGLEYGIGYNIISTSKNRLSLMLSGSLGLAPAEDTDLLGIHVRGTKNHSVGLTLRYERKAL